MAVKLSSLELPELSSWLEQHFPSTIRMLGELKSHMSGKFPDLDFFVDKWPHPQAAVAIIDPNSQLEFKGFCENLVCVFAETDEAFTSLLKADARFVDWSKPAYFKSVPSSLGPALMSLVKENVACEADIKRFRLLKATPSDLKPVSVASLLTACNTQLAGMPTLLYSFKEQISQLSGRPVPQGMQISTITDAAVDTVDSTWYESNKYSKDYIRHIARHYHTVVMTTACGQHVGHMIQTTSKLLRLLYVTPHFREKGYAKVIVTQLAQKVFNDGEDVYLLVEESNTRSLNLHLSVGFKPWPIDLYFRVHTHPASDLG